MINSTKGEYASELVSGRCPKVLQRIRAIAERKLGFLDSAAELKDLRSPPGNMLESLKGDRAGQYSIRINDRYRICFRWHDGDAYDVEIVDYPDEGKEMVVNGMRAIHPGEVIREDYLAPLQMSPTALAQALHVPVTRIHEIVKERRSITADTAVRLGKLFSTSPELWMNLQASYDLRKAQDLIGAEVDRDVVPLATQAG